MPRPRKRKRSASAGQGAADDSPLQDYKKKKNGNKASGGYPPTSRLVHPILGQYYPCVQNLREYVITQLPPSSRLRRRKISAIGKGNVPLDTKLPDIERSLGVLLDTTLVGHSSTTTEEGASRMHEWKTFSQRGDESYITISNGVAGHVESQALIVEYVVRTLFNREKTAKWPDHLLCNGFRRNGSLGLRTVRPNPYVQALQQSPWPQLLALLGESGEQIMIDLLLNGAIFVSVATGTNNVCQLSGRSLSNIPLYRPVSTQDGPTPRVTQELVFVRGRMFYARPALNARGHINFGLRHIHVLNRCSLQQPGTGEDEQMRTRLKQQNDVHTLKVMMYIFPRQFGLHNVFTSKVNTKETSQRLKDYTLREEEIFERFGRLGDDGVQVKIPKRLRGLARDLVQKLQTLHRRCSYTQLLHHYCPVRLATNASETGLKPAKFEGHVRKQAKNKSGKRVTHRQKLLRLPQRSPDTVITELATSPTEVVSFCQAILKTVVPRGFWGQGLEASSNEHQFLKKIDMFISLRRFEVMSLDELTRGMKITNIEWLASHQLMAHKTSLTDIQKRWELFNEFLYFLLDSILIPLIRSNFYVTESNTDKYRVFFFRHDVWRSFVEPAMITLRGKMLEEISLAEAEKIMESRRLGFSHIRLLPKGTQMRPITNLRKRLPIHGRSKELGPGINKILAPAHTILQLERGVNPDRLGSALFSVGDIYKRIKPFKDGMSALPARFYFAKVDVQAAFDTIPQAAIVSLLNSIPQKRQYRITKYLEVSPSTASQGICQGQKGNPIKKWPLMATNNAPDFIRQLGTGGNTAKRNTVFVDLYEKQYDTSELLQLIASHIQQNLIKIGKKYYRQKRGIPQGSILSSTLCNYFYADLETHVLSFLKSADCLLLRLIDDFLLITTDELKAARFVEVLHQGVPEYGVTVNNQKTLVNFDLVVNGEAVPKVEDDGGFPYCGTLINTRTLGISRASRQNEDKSIYNSLTVEFSRAPGQTFQRKVLNAFKIQSHLMFFDTKLNSGPVMLNNVYRAFVETANKMWAYARCLPAPKQPPPGVIIKTIQKLINTAYVLLVSKTRRLRFPGYACDVKKCEVSWLAYNAFHQVLSRKQSNYSETLAWLKAEKTKLSLLKNIRHARVQNIV